MEPYETGRGALDHQVVDPMNLKFSLEDHKFQIRFPVLPSFPTAPCRPPSCPGHASFFVLKLMHLIVSMLQYYICGHFTRSQTESNPEFYSKVTLQLN
jgi:hypothetical protein